MRERVGTLLRTRHTRNATLRDATYPSGLKMPRHAHGPAHISLILTGGFDETMASRQWDLRAGSVIFRPAENEHAVSFGPVQTRILNVELHPAVVDYARDADIPVDQPADLSGSRSSWLIARLHDEFRRKDPISSLALDSLILDLLVELGRGKASSQPTEAMKHVEEYVREHLDQKLSLEDIAREAKMHPVSLARAFRRVYGCTVGTYVRRLRLERATELLTTSKLSISEIARELGFSDHSHFARVFKAETGFTPSLCQRAHSQG